MKIGWRNQVVGLGGTVLQLSGDAGELVSNAEQIIERTVKGRVDRALQEQSSMDFSSEFSSGLNAQQGTRDFSEQETVTLVWQMAYLYSTNPEAKATTDFNVDYVVGEGFTFESDNDSNLEVLNDFWEKNGLEISQERKVRELGLLGEQFYPVEMNSVTGAVEMGYIDPARVMDVAFVEGNSEKIDKIKVQSSTFGAEPKVMDVIRDRGNGVLEGDVFMFTVNRLSKSKRGKSDMLTSADWFDLLDQFLFNAAERALMQQAYVWDVTLEGMPPEELKRQARKYRSAPKPGSVRFHNEKVKWDTVGPKSGAASDTQTMFKTIRTQGLTGQRTPEHLLVEGGETNFATAKAMNSPVFRRLKRRQNLWVHIWNEIFKFVLEQAEAHGMPGVRVEDGFTVTPSQIDTQDFETASNTLGKLGDTFFAAEQRGYITHEAAGKAYRDSAMKMGIDFGLTDEEMATFAQEKAERDEAEPPDELEDELMRQLQRSRESYEKMLRAAG